MRTTDYPPTIRPKIDAFTRGYIECALWLLDEEDPMFDQADVTDLSEEALAEIVADCAAFQEENGDDLYYAWAELGRDDEHLGHDFYLTRNGHGAGFWDRGTEEVWERLTAASRPYGTQGLYSGDDGRLYTHG